MSPTDIQKNLKHNLSVNIADGGFFGLGLGFSSFVTILPLFVSTMTKNALLIGLIPAIHNVGWQLPQLFTAYSTSKQNRYLSMLNRLTVHERLPFLFLAVVAWFSPKIGPQTTLILTFILLIWQGLGGGISDCMAVYDWQDFPARYPRYFLWDSGCRGKYACQHRRRDCWLDPGKSDHANGFHNLFHGDQRSHDNFVVFSCSHS